MIKIGLLGEDPNDTTSIKNLLSKKFKEKVKFYPLANRINGDQLDSPKIKTILSIECKDKGCHFVVYIRDLDGFKSDTEKIKSRQNWFLNLDKIVDKEGILLLNIWELECLILADIETFNEIYHTNFRFTGDPMAQKEPKEKLKQITFKQRKQFKEFDCPEIFKKLNIDTVQNRCSYFKSFLAELDKKIESKF